MAYIPSADPVGRLLEAIANRTRGKAQLIDPHQRHMRYGRFAEPMTNKGSSATGTMTHWHLAGDTGSAAQIDEGETATITGTTQHVVTMSGNSATIGGTDATTSVKGHASFSSTYFTTASGAVSLAWRHSKYEWNGATLAAGSVVSPTSGAASSWREDADGAATAVSPVSAVPWLDYDRANGQIDRVYGDWTWVAVRDDAHAVHIQTDLMVAAACREITSTACTAVCKALVKLSAAAHFQSVKIILSDGSGDNTSKAASADFKADADGVWYLATLAATDVSSWDGHLHVGIDAQGKHLSNADTFETHVYIAYISIELYGT